MRAAREAGEHIGAWRRRIEQSEIAVGTMN